MAPPLADAALEQAIQRLPKAELHLHLEGAFPWPAVRALHPQGSELPTLPPWRAGTARWDFDRFLEIFRHGVQPATGTVEAVEELTCATLRDLAHKQLRYVEITLSQSFHRLGGLSQDAVLASIARGRARAVAERGIEVRFSYGLNRHAPLQTLCEELEQALAWQARQPRPLFDGIDLQGDERVGATREFAPLFALARGAGLRLRAHAGELSGAASVRDAIDVLGVQQLAHGVRAVEDPGLVRELAARGIWLHVCPTSNVQLGVFPSYAAHPLLALIEAGCRVTVGSDDPLIFGSDIVDEYRTLVRHFGVDRAGLAGIAKAGFAASQLGDAQQRAAGEAIDAALLA